MAMYMYVLICLNYRHLTDAMIYYDRIQPVTMFTSTHTNCSIVSIGVIYGGYGGTLLGVGGYCTPLFGRMTEKNNSNFPSSSAHVRKPL